jgi:hypothetical protein
MSKYINVNPGQYKVAGRAHPGDPLLQEYSRRELTVMEHETPLPPPPRETPNRSGGVRPQARARRAKT